jgi:hypothetical protein
VLGDHNRVQIREEKRGEERDRRRREEGEERKASETCQSSFDHSLGA